MPNAKAVATNVQVLKPKSRRAKLATIGSAADTLLFEAQKAVRFMLVRQRRQLGVVMPNGSIREVSMLRECVA